MATGFPVKANYATGDVLTAANMNDLSGTVNYLQYMPPRNPVLNSNFSVWQRGTSSSNPTTVASSYGADRWSFWRASGFTTGITMSRQTTSDTTNLPNIQYCTRIQRTAGNTSTVNSYLAQNFESINSIPFAGKQVTLSFYARKGADFSGTFSGAIGTGTGTDQNLINGFTGSADVGTTAFTLTTSWQRFTLTGTIGSSATQIAPYFWHAPTGTAGTNDYFEITGVQLELGSSANTYMPNQSTYQGELAACQRYYWRWTTGGTSTAWIQNVFNYSSTVALGSIKLPVTMRVNPTSIDVTATAADYRVLTGSTVSTCSAVPVLDTSNFESPLIKYTVASGLTVGQGGIAGANTTNNAYIGFNAEL